MACYSLSCRAFLQSAGGAIGLLGLADLSAGAGANTPRGPHFRAQGQKRHLSFLPGGPSHVDPFDPKPAPARDAGRRPSTTGACFSRDARRKEMDPALSFLDKGRQRMGREICPEYAQALPGSNEFLFLK